MADEVEAIQGEYGYWFAFTLKNADRTLHDLEGITAVAMRVAELGEDGQAIGTGAVYGDVEDAVVRVTISISDSALLTKARYEAQVIIESASQKLITKPFILKIGRAI